MKRNASFTVLLGCAIFLATLIVNTASAQTAGGKPIPDNVKKIADKSCMKCHIEPGGNGMAASVLNLAKWDTYSADKQAAKAKAMSKMVSKGKMPPKNFKSSHPEGVPSKEEIKTISDWALSLQPPKK
jgi:hypothetical protein